MKSKSKFFSGALFLGLGAFLSKLLGAVYRVPLTNLLGAEGLGLYQMVFPIYTVLLDFSGAGVPSSISKIIAEKRSQNCDYNPKRILISSLKLFSIIGLISCFIMLVFSYPLAILQGNSKAFLGYIFLSPAVLVVSLISCFRGYFQGQLNMKPTAISQVIEQVIKLCFGLLFVFLFLPNISLAVGGATLAVTISELVALLYVYLKYKKSNIKEKIIISKKDFYGDIKEIIKLTIPITLLGIAIPFSQVIDSFLVVNILKTYKDNATTLYGLFSGTANTIINLPVSICYGISMVAIPLISGAKAQHEKDSKGKKVILITLLFSIPSAIFCYYFAPFIVRVLFNSLIDSEKSITISLIRILSINVVLLSTLQTENAILIGKGKPYFAVISIFIGIIIRTILNAVLLYNKNLNIYASAIASITCYFLAVLINLIVIFSLKVKNVNKATNSRQIANQE